MNSLGIELQAIASTIEAIFECECSVTEECSSFIITVSYWYKGEWVGLRQAYDGLLLKALPPKSIANVIVHDLTRMLAYRRS